MASTTRIVRNTKVAWSGMSSVMVRLMMVVNDLGIINESLRHWNTSTDEERRGRKGGGRAFFVRVQMAYVFEGLGVIKDIRADKGLMEKVGKCDRKTQDCFNKVCAFIDSVDYPLLAEFRNSAGFHYDAKRAVRGVEEIATEFPEDTSSMTLGTESLDWYFQLGDKVHEKIVVRYIFEVPKDRNVVKESDAIAGRVFDVAEALAEFAGYFVWEYTNSPSAGTYMIKSELVQRISEQYPRL
jgi:hypothetical protein